MKISVVMAAFNGERYIEGQLNSIINQTLKPDEIIICDDDSTDGTIEILKRYEHNAQFKVIINSQRLGLIKNFKNAVGQAKEGNYIALSDQDDIWLPEKLEKCAEHLRQIEQKEIPCLVHSDLLFVDLDERIINTSFRKHLGQHKYQQNLNTLVYGNFLNGCTSLFNPAMKGFFASMPDRIALNHDGWMALVAFTFGRVAYINEPLVKYRKHDNNASIDRDKKVHSRLVSTLKQVVNSFQSNDGFLSAQFDTVAQFYECYKAGMDEEKRQVFDNFLNLKNASFLIKKFAFAKVVRKYSL